VRGSLFMLLALYSSLTLLASAYMRRVGYSNSYGSRSTTFASLNPAHLAIFQIRRNLPRTASDFANLTRAGNAFGKPIEQFPIKRFAREFIKVFGGVMASDVIITRL
jgi:hypothetical protein